MYQKDYLKIMIESEKAEPKCVYEDVLKTCSEGDKTFAQKCLKDQRIQSIRESSSKERTDGFHSIFKRHYRYHTSCYSTYKSKKVIEKYKNAK